MRFDQAPVSNIPDLATIFLILLFVLASSWLLRCFKPKKRSRRRADKPQRIPKLTVVSEPKISDEKPKASGNSHLDAIANVSFVRQKVLNREEFKVLQVLEKTSEDLGPSFRLLIQPSLGELIKPDADFHSVSGKAAYRAVMAKRLDFGIVDKNGYLVAAIEYQGSGHYQQKAFVRDAVKREALRKAGIDLIEIKKGELPSDLDRRVRKSIAKFTSEAVN